MKKSLLFTILVLLVPAFAGAHVSVRPRESKPGGEERYTVRVPTEGVVATTHAVLEIPADVTVLEVLPTEGATFETAKQGDRITSIAWKKAIPPKAAAEFVFRARNPAAGEIVWKAHQHFSDGTVADWVGVAGDKRPASVTRLSGQSAAGGPSGIKAARRGACVGRATASTMYSVLFRNYRALLACGLRRISVNPVTTKERAIRCANVSGPSMRRFTRMNSMANRIEPANTKYRPKTTVSATLLRRHQISAQATPTSAIAS